MNRITYNHNRPLNPRSTELKSFDVQGQVSEPIVLHFIRCVRKKLQCEKQANSDYRVTYGVRYCRKKKENKIIR